MWRLEVLDWAGPDAWRWRLTDDKGGFVADHTARVDRTDWQFEAFTDLHRYLRWTAAPDRRLRHEAEIVEQLGDWIATLLGPVGPALAQHRGPVHVEVPAAATVLGHLPWELARVDGRTLAAHRVTLVVVAQPHREQRKLDVGERLRILAVFSLPEGAGALNLRKERVALARLVQRIAKVNGRAIELQVLQYGATRQRLEDALLEEPGWDVVHLSGHGLPTGLLLEKSTGQHDLISSTELVELLGRGRDQIKLVTLSACESAAVTAAEHLQQLGLAPAVRDTTPEAPGATKLPAVAAALVDELDCAVLAMRYPVVDDFAIALSGSFYELLLGRGQPVARALALSLTQRQVVPAEATAGVPPLSIGTPVLFGPRAAGLTLAAPSGPPVLETAAMLARFPDQPPRFVGRVGPLTRAAAALAPESERPAVVLYGMAGAGKTACALELAYTHEQAFGFAAWFAAPPDGTHIGRTLTDFALATEQQISGLAWVHLVEDAATLRAFLPQLTAILAQNRVLLVIDNAESLLTDDGQWRDERWAAVIAALTAHQGLSRLVLTSRRLPAGLPDTVLVEPVHALSPAESVLLARELPRLGGLIDGSDLPAGMTADAGRAAAARVLHAVQGHPKLLELADGAAADPAALAAQLDEADRAWLERGVGRTGFLRDTAGSEADYTAVLTGWARSAATQLPPDALLLFQLICGLEDTDRQPDVLAAVWPLVWTADGRAGPAPGPAPLLALLAGHALLATDSDPDGTLTGWRVHPGIAEAVRAATDPTFTDRIDDTLANAWLTTLHNARTAETGQDGAWLLRAARSAAPYLHRRHRWTDLDHAAQQVLARDPGVAAAAALAPLLDRAATATRGTDDELDLARTHALTMLRLDPARGTTLLQDLLTTATTREDWNAASALAGDLINRYRTLGRYDQALTLADSMIDYTRRAGYGPWTQLLDQTRRLQIQLLRGEARAVLDGVERARARMAGLPTTGAGLTTEVVEPWQVRETILNTGALAASDLGEWEQALAFNAETRTSQHDRGAGPHEQARAAFTGYGPLIRLGRLDEARDLLLGCRAAFAAADDLTWLGKTLSALAHVEAERGHADRAIDLEQQALRYRYTVGDPDDIGVGHANLASPLGRAGADPALVVAHRAAAAILAHQTGSGQRLPGRLTALGELLAAHPDRAPGTFAEVCALVGQVPGVDLAALLDHLPRRSPDGDSALSAVLDGARAST